MIIENTLLNEVTQSEFELSPVVKTTADNLQKAVIKDTSSILNRRERDSQSRSIKEIT